MTSVDQWIKKFNLEAAGKVKDGIVYVYMAIRFNLEAAGKKG